MVNVVFIPLRGGSKSIPNKNIKLFNGRPLAYWVIDAAVNSKYVDKVYISTDSPEIREVILKYNNKKVKVISRSHKTSTDNASTESAMLEFAQNTAYKFDNIALIQCTSPLLSSVYLDKGFEQIINKKCDSVISLVRQKRFVWEEQDGFVSPKNYDYTKRPMRQNFNGFLVENGSFYIISKKILLENKCRLGGNIGYVEMPEYTYYEIDEEDDWSIVESLGKKHLAFPDTKKIKAFFCDCDGVLTDGGMYYTQLGDEIKKFNATDGMGFKLLRENKIITGIISGEYNTTVRNRGLKLNVDEIHLGIMNKLEVIDKLKEKYNLKYDEIAYLGDDINDLEVIKNVGFGCAVSNGAQVCKSNAKYITIRNGGNGAVREVVDIILNSQNNSQL